MKVGEREGEGEGGRVREITIINSVYDHSRAQLRF